MPFFKFNLGIISGGISSDLLWNTIEKLASLILVPHSEPPQDDPPPPGGDILISNVDKCVHIFMFIR